MKTVLLHFIALAAVLGGTGCRREMYYQPKENPLRGSDLFSDGASARPLPLHTVPQENYHADVSYDTGQIGTNFLDHTPMAMTRQLLDRGHERFDIYCSMCHGRDGQARGIVVERGFPAPPILSIDRLRAAPIGYFVNVIARGHGVMYSYANRVPDDDRWAIAAYIRALQLSEHATLADLTPAEREKVEAAK